MLYLNKTNFFDFIKQEYDITLIRITQKIGIPVCNRGIKTYLRIFSFSV